MVIAKKSKLKELLLSSLGEQEKFRRSLAILPLMAMKIE
jgi:hypothetical protein